MINAQSRLRTKIQSMSMDELIEAIVALVPRRYKTRSLAEGYVSSSLTVKTMVSNILTQHALEDFYTPEWGFLPGIARDSYVLTYCSLYGTGPQLSRPLAYEALAYESLAQARVALQELGHA